MRLSQWIGAAVLAVALGGSARAQNVANTFQVPAAPTIQSTPINTSSAVASPNLTNTSSFSFGSFFSRLFGLGSPTIGQSTVPAAPASAIAPLPPISSTVQKFQ